MSGMIAFPRKLALPTIALAIGGWILTFATPAIAADEAGAVDGIFETVQNPITDATLMQIKNRIDRAINQPGGRIKKVVFDFNPGDSEAATPNYGSCRDFADYIQKLKDNGIYTIAFVHAKTTRHTVLPALACNDLVMSSNAKIGEVAAPNESMPADIAAMYARVAGKSKEAVVLKMLDKNIQVVSGRKDGNVVYVDEANADKDDVIIADRKKAPVLPRGSLGLYDLAQALQFGLCTLPMESRTAVKEHYNLTTASLHGDRTGGKPIKAVRIDLQGTINEAFFQKLKNQLKEVRAKKENRIFFIIECNSGNAAAARQVADEILNLKNDDNDPIWTVAFIPNKASDLAAFIAFACSEIVMFKGSDSSREATIGDFESFLTTSGRADASNDAEYIRRNLGEIAEQQGYPRVIVDGFLDRDSSIVQVRDKNKAGDSHELMTGREFEIVKQRKGAQVTLIKTIKQPGTYLNLNATLAKELRIAQSTVDNKDPKEVYTLHGLAEKDIRDSKPGWLDDLASFLRRTEIIFLLLAVAFAALILEFKMPGATLPGLVSLTCFVLFFWSQAYAHGATIYLAIGLFVLGLIMLGIEIFVLPGFGVMGIGGILLILGSLGLATMEKAPSTTEDWMEFASRLVQYGASLFVSCGLAFALARFLPKIPYANRLMLAPPSDNPEAEAEASILPGMEQAALLLGQVGTATSMLRPAGMARIGDLYVDVITEGDFITPGTAIQVVEVEGTRIVVKKV